MGTNAVNQRAHEMHQDHNAPPVNPLPPVVWLLFLGIAVPELIFLLGENRMLGGAQAVGWRITTISHYGFSGTAFDWMFKTGVAPLEYAVRVFTYPFLHNAFTSAIFSGVMLLAMGKLVGEAMGQFAVLLIFVLSGVFGAVMFGLITDQTWLIGAFPCVYGLIGGYTFLMWQKLAGTGAQQLQAFQLIGFLMGINLVFGIFFTTGYDWIAELAGFVCGFGISAIVVPGGLARIRAALRRN
jgi:membrane associated rhomboid family serine protease